MFMNGFNRETILSCNDDAMELFNLFLQYSDGEGNLCEDGFKRMGEVFEEVPPTLRSLTFELFIAHLDANEIEYCIEDFQGEID